MTSSILTAQSYYARTMIIRKKINISAPLTPEQKQMLEEMNKHPIRYDEDCPAQTDAQFRRKYGFFGEKAKSPSELEKEEVSGGRRMYFPSDFPDLYPTYDELYEKWSDSYDEICEYRNECRKEFFELFSEYFWDLWY